MDGINKPQEIIQKCIKTVDRKPKGDTPLERYQGAYGV
jgi:hypothetical protein